MRRSLILVALTVLTACSAEAFGPPKADLAVDGPPGHPPGRPPGRDRGARAYAFLPPAMPGADGQFGPPTLPGLATETVTREVKPEYAVPDAEVSYGAPGSR
ncbi:hypothetical protein [Swaminathania salitolerans]|uniref:Lipoprotein n=1 Tax=Swaminathania salitolerans TaxID=182838 RepID=A0A511BSR0_9PROT|nr:hypothetical protein [Swaminathania salitolerans]GBQ11852.1 hypothetical protein AA21291_0985 [Swaminathania salitolerans LMG 21291]GEL02644.1 hypothetical protein SSA02_18070 [Swaminathania salitolerans]